MVKEDKIICKHFLNDADKTHSCNEYKLLMALLEQEPCEDAISRADMLDAIGHGTTYTSEELQRIIKNLLPVNPQPKIGHWIGIDEKSAVCSCCNRNNTLYGDFCKWCGAKMVESER